MFAVLVVKPSGRHGIVGALLDRLMRRRAFVQKKTIMGVQYSQLTVFETKRGIYWTEIERLCGLKCGNLVMPRGLKPPSDSCVVPFVPLRFYSYLVRNTAIEIIKKSDIQLYRRMVGVVDIEGVYQQTVLELIHHCSAVRILTDNEQRYNAFCTQVMDTYGAPVIATADPHSLANCVLIVAPSGISALQAESLTAPVISATDTQKPVRCPVICDLEVEIPPNLAGSIPEGIEPTDFLGALFEMGGIKEITSVCAAGGRCKGRNLSISEVSRYITDR